MWGIFFGEFQCLPIDDCPAASCDSGVLVRGSESTSFYSAVLVPPQLISPILNSYHLLSTYYVSGIGVHTLHVFNLFEKAKREVLLLAL